MSEHCWICGDWDVVEEYEVIPNHFIWLCPRHARMRGRTQAEEIGDQRAKEIEALRQWATASEKRERGKVE